MQKTDTVDAKSRHFPQKPREADIALQVERWERMRRLGELCVNRRPKRVLESTFS